DRLGHLAEALLLVVHALFVALALDRDPGEVRGRGDELELLRARLARLRVIHRERAEHLAGRREDGLGPARADLRADDEVAEPRPVRVDEHVLHDHALAQRRRGAARADVRTDRDAIDGARVELGQARRGPAAQALVVV